MKKKAQAINNVVKLVIALVVLAILVYIGYKFVLGPGEEAGGFGDCEKQAGSCTTLGEACSGKKVFGLGCPVEGKHLVNQRYCCLRE
jgi:hypothetical protein